MPFCMVCLQSNLQNIESNLQNIESNLQNIESNLQNIVELGETSILEDVSRMHGVHLFHSKKCPVALDVALKSTFWLFTIGQ